MARLILEPKLCTPHDLSDLHLEGVDFFRRINLTVWCENHLKLLVARSLDHRFGTRKTLAPPASQRKIQEPMLIGFRVILTTAFENFTLLVFVPVNPLGCVVLFAE